MTTFLVLLSLLFLIVCVVEFLFYDTKIRELRRQYRLLNKQYSLVKSKVSPSSQNLKNLKIKYVPSSFSSGITKENTTIYLTPVDKAIPVCKLVEAHDLPILEECVIANNIWLYVEMDSEDNVNSRGWIERKDFSFLKDKIQII